MLITRDPASYCDDINYGHNRSRGPLIIADGQAEVHLGKLGSLMRTGTTCPAPLTPPLPFSRPPRHGEKSRYNMMSIQPSVVVSDILNVSLGLPYYPLG